MTMHLIPEALDLWLASDELAPSRHAAYLALLNGEEKRQQQRFHFAADRTRYLVTRVLVRTVLSRYAPLAPSDWKFHTNAYGRPSIANDLPFDGGLDFNLSHTRGLIVLGVGRRQAFGVDIENVAVRSVSPEIAERFFSAAEVRQLYEVSAERRLARFFEYWTFKESYIKARGMGLSIPLDHFGFDLSAAGAVRLNVMPQLKDRADRWTFWQFRPTPDHLLAVCAERTRHLQAPRIRSIDPLASDAVFDVGITRMSSVSADEKEVAHA